MDRDWGRGWMSSTMHRDFFAEMDDCSESSTMMPMDVDDNESECVERFGGVIGGFFSSKPYDRDFFNSFEDDFDDSDIN
ncbi:hypothetical protein EUTSA_v10003020mg [Eutrema salsugineum]|uniref:Uncharacterized protein n=1 Tax=Eutrema salsugineum TaxID=72664 RepID=V4KH99_EUTSA|nr:hypothetical protein EUTSA_v10003020mg [Eutrema salsugineum]